MIELFEFQQIASAQIADRFRDFMSNRPMRGTQSNPVALPFYQALSSVTASGKTIILADAVLRINASTQLKPVVLWLSKGRVVVSQTYANLQDGGKYRHLIKDLSVHLLSEYNPEEVKVDDEGMIFFATVGTFNQKDKELGERLIYQSDIDTAEQSTWEALQKRENAEGIRRPLIIVYDEGHNLSDQQTELLMELQPDALLVASATMRLPSAIARLLDTLKEDGWDNEKVVTEVSSGTVAESGLIKNELLLGGYAAPMAKAIDDMLISLQRAEKSTEQLQLNFIPKAIYVSKTNIIEGNSFKKDDPKRPFYQREAPPIVIWRYLVEEKKVDPSRIAVYATLEFDKNYPPPEDFIIYKGGDKDYENFIEGNYQHVIFNQSLQEGWDDPACYFAYIDKSMGSNVQVEQVIGRVLRQPEAKHYTNDILNTAHFYVRVDTKNIFTEIVTEVRQKLRKDAPSIEITSYDSVSGLKLTTISPQNIKTIPSIYLDASATLEPIQKLIDEMNDYRSDSGVNIKGEGARALVQQRIGNNDEQKWRWVPYESSNKVSARWVFQLSVMKRYPRALQVTPSDNPKFDAMIEFGSRAHTHIEKLAEEVVNTYLDKVELKHNIVNPYTVSDINVDLDNMIKFKHSLHEGYSNLNKLELLFALAVDQTKLTWSRNPSRSGFGIPLLSMGTTKTFYPDFLIWRNKEVIAIDTTGGHLLLEKTGRKLLSITPPDRGKSLLSIKLISSGKWNENVQEIDKTGFTVWSLRNDKMLGNEYCTTPDDAVRICLR